MWTLVLQQGMECRPPALEAQSLSQYTTRDVPIWDFQPLAFVTNSAKNTGLKVVFFVCVNTLPFLFLKNCQSIFQSGCPTFIFKDIFSMCKESACNAEDTGDTGSNLGKIPWRRKWQPTPVFLPGESQGQRSLVGHSPWGL